jgi:hypothetical protein
MGVDLRRIRFGNYDAPRLEQREHFTIEWPQFDGTSAQRRSQNFSPTTYRGTADLICAECPEDLACLIPRCASSVAAPQK